MCLQSVYDYFVFVLLSALCQLKRCFQVQFVVACRTQCSVLDYSNSSAPLRDVDACSGSMKQRHVGIKGE